MKKLTFILLIAIIAITGCSVKNKGWENPVPTDFATYIDSLIYQGWRAYSSGETDVSYSKFDSVLAIEAKSSEGYIGRGFSSIDLGSDDPSAFSSAATDFGFALYLEGGNPVTMEDSALFQFTGFSQDSSYYLLSLPDTTASILGIFEDVMVLIYTPDTVNTYTTDLTLRYFNSSVVKVPVVTREFIDPNDTTLFVPDSNTQFVIHAAYTKATAMEELAGAACAGFSQLYQLTAKQSEKEDEIKSELMKSIAYGNALKLFYPKDDGVENYLPERFDDRINSMNVYTILAQDYYYYGLYINCYWQLYDIADSLVNGIDTTAADLDVQLLKVIGNL